ncbi:MAG: adenylosuccinate lyase [Planctomycetes bacterium]|nr:adenylosuccinate lyase [Planctomycetota bacterium]
MKGLIKVWDQNDLRRLSKQYPKAAKNYDLPYIIEHLSYDVADNPLVVRYASAPASQIFSPAYKYSLWRYLWIALAEAEQELGVAVTDQQLDEMRQHADDIDFKRAAELESQLRHDVMAHVHAFGEVAPKAMPIIHLGATSCFVADNAELIQIREGLRLVRRRLLSVIAFVAKFAREQRAQPVLARTHYQPAQLTTVGKRACLWLYDLVTDLEEIDTLLARLAFRSTKGTTGTQGSFLSLFDGDHEKVRTLERRVAEKMGFDKVIPVTGQTYSRKLDARVVAALAQIATSAHKFANDLRLMAGTKEMEEPFARKQIGSSAMAYKRNPMRSERMTALARYVIGLVPTAAQTAAEQWLERTLDDSATRRLVLSQAFLATDAILLIFANVADGLVVYPKILERVIAEELPFMATENILMAGVRSGGDRQDLHERIRQHSQDAARTVKVEGKPNDLIDRLRKDKAFAKVDLDAELAAEKFIGRSIEQVDEFLADVVDPILKANADDLSASAPDLRV